MSKIIKPDSDVVFDLDGTLVDLIAKTEYYQEQFCKIKGLSGWNTKSLADNYRFPDQKDLGWGVPIAEQPALLKDYYAHIIENFHQPNMAPHAHEGIDQLLQDVCAVRRSFVATSRDKYTTMLTLQQNNMDGYFHGIVTKTCITEAGGRDKPHGDMLHYLANHHQLTHNGLIVVGDTTMDVEMGKAVGAKVVGMTYGNHTEEELRDAGADYIAHTAHDARKIILSL